jgi:protein SCO1/2
MEQPFSSNLALLTVACLLVLALTSREASAHEAGDAKGHAAHVAPAARGLKVSTVDYALPAITLVRDDGTKVSLPKELDDGRPVMLNFIYTTCPGICPVMSQVFSQLQERLGADREHVHMVSISIDPEQDTPARLREYARKFSAGRQWQHYTGTVAASVAVQRAFDVYRGDKMSHDPLTLMRPAPGKPWVRIEGFASPNDLLAQYLALAALCEPRPVALR